MLNGIRGIQFLNLCEGRTTNMFIGSRISLLMSRKAIIIQSSFPNLLRKSALGVLYRLASFTNVQSKFFKMLIGSIAANS